MKSAVILNDTRADYHHGCSRVMTILERGLQDRGFVITACSPLRHRWWEDTQFLKYMAQADRVIINGEGTLHHGRSAGVDLLKVVEHEACRAPVYLVNALYQENPESWAHYLSAFAGIWVRDSRSAAELLEKDIQINGVLPDMTLCDGPIAPQTTRQGGVIIGDSVDHQVSDELRALATRSNSPFTPSLSHLKRPKGRTRLGRFLRDRYIARFEEKVRREFTQLQMSKNMEDYARKLANADLHITGRFHGVCFSILTGTPFVALQSNSWKIEMLLHDLGLSKERLVSREDLAKIPVTSDWQFSDLEKENIKIALRTAQTNAAQMFDTIEQGRCDIET